MSFIAKYRSPCAECGDDVRRGDLATFTAEADGEIRHVKCPEGPLAPIAARGTCPSCFLELPVRGECECRQ